MPGADASGKFARSNAREGILDISTQTLERFIFPLPCFILLCAVHSSSFLHSSTHAGNGRRSHLLNLSKTRLPSFTLVTAAAVLHQSVWSFFVLLLEAVFAMFSIAQETATVLPSFLHCKPPPPFIRNASETKTKERGQ
ncbi:transmembrane protein, putative [Medicago truncatula]|uniref:Transmembrane protein, putative n=1 Tax=Medicago truncatula TaxID=3880 RepID=G7JR25_MEDTR|nr:transmembrane protein, putative [Medicago truncatula]